MPDYNTLMDEFASKGGLIARTKGVLRPLVSPGQPYALLDYPLYNNPGDAAIWVGARRLLEAVMQRPPAHVSTLGGFDAAACRRAIGEGMIFILGGGNFGSLYPRHHAHKLDMIRRMPDNSILHLPFSIAGTDPRIMAETARVLAGHGQVHLIAREGHSQALIAEHLGLSVPMAPDTAHALTPVPHLPLQAQTRLIRRDRETRAAEATGPDDWDWSDLGGLRRVNRLGKLAYHLTRGARRAQVLDRLAASRVEIACDRLGQAQTVVTDRLHGMILALLLGRPVTAHDNATGKLRAYVESWGAELGPVTLRDIPPA